MTLADVRRRLSRLRGYVAAHGVRKTAGAMLELAVDRRFDARYGTGTQRQLSLHELDVSSPNKHFGAHFEPTRARPCSRSAAVKPLPAG